MMIDDLNHLIEMSERINSSGYGEKTASASGDVIAMADEILNEINSGKMVLANEVDLHSMINSMEKQAACLAREVVGLQPSSSSVLSGPEILSLIFPV